MQCNVWLLLLLLLILPLVAAVVVAIEFESILNLPAVLPQEPPRVFWTILPDGMLNSLAGILKNII